MKQTSKSMAGLTAMLLAALSLCAPGICANEPEQALPEEVKNLTQKVLDIRSLAFKESPGKMRSEAGVHGREVEALLDQIAEKISGDPSLVERVSRHQASDIHTKIAWWALDRAKRPEAYERFAAYYINFPVGRVEEYYTRPHLDKIRGYLFELQDWHSPGMHETKSRIQADPNYDPDSPEPPKALTFETLRYMGYLPPRGGLFAPNPIPTAEWTEENRELFEYHYFLPPTGERFEDEKHLRVYLLDILWSLGGQERSDVIFVAELAMNERLGDEVFVGEHRNYPGSQPIRWLLLRPSQDTFRQIARFYRDPIREGVEHWMKENYMSSHFLRNWDGKNAIGARRPIYTRPNPGPEIYANLLRWRELATLNWELPLEQEFARWLLAYKPSEVPENWPEDEPVKNRP
jgi:hypothetical protein